MERHVLHLDDDLGAARRARAFVRAALSGEADDGLVDDTLLVTSELVSNAVMHAGSASELELRVEPGSVEVRLSDGDPRLPLQRKLLGGPSAQGRGLVLLSGLAQRWGVEPRADGKTVWALLTSAPRPVSC